MRSSSHVVMPWRSKPLWLCAVALVLSLGGRGQGAPFQMLPIGAASQGGPVPFIGGWCTGTVPDTAGGTLSFVATVSQSGPVGTGATVVLNVTLTNRGREAVPLNLHIALWSREGIVGQIDLTEAESGMLPPRKSLSIRPERIPLRPGAAVWGIQITGRTQGAPRDPAFLLGRVKQEVAQGRPQVGLSLADRALLSARGARDGLAEALALGARAQVLETAGFLGNAGEAWQAAAQACRRVGHGPGWVEALGRARILEGRPASADDLLGGVTWQPTETLPFAAALQTLGESALAAGCWGPAEDYLLHALDRRDKLANGTREHAQTLDSLGVVVWYRGDLERAGRCLEAAREIEKKVAPGSRQEALTQEALGSVAVSRGGDNLAEAERLLRGALEIEERLGQEADRDEAERKALRMDAARTKNSLGVLMARRGEREEARKCHEEAVLVQEELAPGSLEVAVTYNNLGVLARERDDFATAKKYHERALDIQRKLSPGSLEEAQSLHNLALVARHGDDWAGAAKLEAEAWEIACRQGECIAGDQAQQAFSERLAPYASTLVACEIAVDHPARALEVLEDARARALQSQILERRFWPEAGGKLWASYQAAVLAQQRALQAASAAASAQTRIQEECERRQRVGAPEEEIRQAQAELEDARAVFKAAQRSLDEANATAAHCAADLRASNPRVAEDPEPVARALEGLPAETLFAAFSVSDQETTLLLGQRDGTVHGWRLPLGAEELRDRVRRFREIVTDAPATDAEVAAAGSKLFLNLFPEPARAALANARRLMFAPDGPLWELPFAALSTSATGAPAYLGTTKPITYTASLRLFRQVQAQKPRISPGDAPKTLVVGISDFGPPADAPRPPLLAWAPRQPSSRGGQPPPKLEHAAKEAARIAAEYGQTPLLDGDATVSRIKALIEDADIVHLATHGDLNPDVPMASALVLSPPRGERAAPDNGGECELPARDIWNMKLNAEIVVLSACQTGLGKNVRGEGIIGLPRALHYAGARSVVASLWRVDDESTATLMVAFHNGIRQGLAKDEALLNAMRKVRATAGSARPYYWAGFLLTGDPHNPIKLGRAVPSPGALPRLAPSASATGIKRTSTAKPGAPSAGKKRPSPTARHSASRAPSTKRRPGSTGASRRRKR